MTIAKMTIAKVTIAKMVESLAVIAHISTRGFYCVSVKILASRFGSHIYLLQY